jgi:hypothetical protein
MVLLLARALDVPLRDRNDLLVAAGYAAIYRESGLNVPAMALEPTAVAELGPPNAMRLKPKPSAF